MSFTPRNLTSASRFSRPRVHAIPQETHDTVRVDDSGLFWDAEGRPLHIDCFDPDKLVADPSYRVEKPIGEDAIELDSTPCVHVARTEKLITPVKPLRGWKAFLHAMFGPTTDEERNRWSIM